MTFRDCDHVNNIVLFGLIALFFLFCVSLQPKIISGENPHDWDVLIYTQNWPSSVCIKWKEKSANSTCNYPPNINDWTIHGIWPTKLGTLGPWFCNTSLPFNMEELYGILPQLEAQWTRVENHKKHSVFWKHEWDKHGTCAAILPQLDTEFKYFLQGLMWNRAYNISEILKNSSIEPSKGTVKATDVIQGVKKSVGKNPFVSCYTHPKTKDVYLLEVKICFDKSLKPVDCDGVKMSGRSRYFDTYRFDSDMDDNAFFGSPLGATANLTDCPLDRNLLFLRSSPSDAEEPKLVVTPLMNMLRLVSFIEWATL